MSKRNKPRRITPYRTYGRAKAAAAGKPIVQIEDIYLVINGTLSDIALTEVVLLSSSGGYAGNVTLSHLNRLGNACHATPTTDPKWQLPPDLQDLLKPRRPVDRPPLSWPPSNPKGLAP